MRIFRPAILILIVLLNAGLSGAVELLPLNGDWRYIQTFHFKLYFQPGQESFVDRVAYKAEIVHAELVKSLKWLPYGHTNIIIADHTDIVNDYASPLPKRTIIVYPAQDIGGRNNFNDWLYEVLVHEYTHILQMDMQSGFPSGFNSLFGRVFLPNIFQPLNQIEGLAVYAESHNSVFGRNNSALSEGMLRAAVYDKKWMPMDRAGVSSPCWPRDASYIYGGKFYQYLAEKYGEKRLALYQRKHSNLVIPWMQNMPAKSVYGKSFSDLWSQWKRYSFKRYSAQVESIKTRGLTEFRRLTDDGFDKTGLAVSHDGKYLAYIDRSSHGWPSLILLDPASGRRKVIDRGNVIGSMDFSRDGRFLAYGKMEYAGLGEKLYGDLYLYDLQNKKIKRLTKAVRARDPAFSGDGQKIYFVRSRMDQNALAVLDLNTELIDHLTDFDREQLFSHPAVSPDGKKMALTVWQPGGYQDIWLYHIENGEWRPLMTDRAQDISPSWSNDGHKIIFASDRSGVWNVYQYSFDSGSLSRITNVIGGAFDPASFDGRLYYLDLGSAGFDLAQAVISDSLDYQTPEYCDTASFVPIEPDSAVQNPSQDYCPVRTMLPFFWFPAGMVDEQGSALGVMLAGSDDLMFKSYTAMMVPDFTSHRFYYRLDYADKSRTVKLGMSLSDRVITEAVEAGGQDTIYFQRLQSQGIALSLPVTRTGTVFSAGLSFHHNNYSSLNGDIFLRDPYWNGHLSRLQLNLDFANARKYGFSISPEHGRGISLESRLYRKELGGALNQTWSSFWWREYLPTPFQHHVLMAGFRAGAWGDGGYVDEDTPDMDPRGFACYWPGSRYRALLTTEYRFPIAYVERGHSTWPLYFKNINGALIFDVGVAADDQENLDYDHSRRSLGAEINTEWLFSYAVPFKMTLGLYHSPRGNGHNKLELRMSSELIW